MNKRLLTKSNYILGLQCPKLLWIKTHERERLPEVDEIRQARFDSGYEIEKLAKKLFPEGINAETKGFMESIEKTQRLISEKQIIFEPAFLIERLYSRADILKPNTDNTWDIFEIKSSTKLKETHINDLAFQRTVYEKAGLKIKSCNLILINNEYIFNGDLEINKLFKILDITKEVNSQSKDVNERIEYFIEILDSKNEPCEEIGMHCDSPYECGVKQECWDKIPKTSIFNLYNINQKAFELYNKGIIKIEEIPEEYPLTTKQLIQKSCIIENKEHIDKEAITDFVKKIKYPIYYLDFETINPGIPKYKGMRPYQRIPFQFSLHIQKDKETKPEHISFLHKEDTDPRPEFIKELKKHLKDSGSIIAYNKSFELTVLKEIVEENKELQIWFEEIKLRFIDLIEPFRRFDYYNKNQKNSTSIKNVLPNLSNLDYTELEISKGNIANTMYEKAIKKETTKEEKEKIFKNLESYCELDTLAEYEIIKGLKKKATID